MDEYGSATGAGVEAIYDQPEEYDHDNVMLPSAQ